jgi:mycothiol system anti-sigma-R factor
MDCEETLTELEAYLDHELSGEEQDRVEAHLTGCSDCFERSEFRLRIRTIVRRKCGATADLPRRAELGRHVGAVEVGDLLRYLEKLVLVLEDHDRPFPFLAPRLAALRPNHYYPET